MYRRYQSDIETKTEGLTTVHNLYIEKEAGKLANGQKQGCNSLSQYSALCLIHAE